MVSPTPYGPGHSISAEADDAEHKGQRMKRDAKLTAGLHLFAAVGGIESRGRDEGSEVVVVHGEATFVDCAVRLLGEG